MNRATILFGMLNLSPSSLIQIKWLLYLLSSSAAFAIFTKLNSVKSSMVSRWPFLYCAYGCAIDGSILWAQEIVADIIVLCQWTVSLCRTKRIKKEIQQRTMFHEALDKWHWIVYVNACFLITANGHYSVSREWLISPIYIYFASS
jgi:hypothetical protein